MRWKNIKTLINRCDSCPYLGFTAFIFGKPYCTKTGKILVDKEGVESPDAGIITIIISIPKECPLEDYKE